MLNIYLKKSTLLALAVGACLQVAQADENRIPIVPVSVVTNTQPNSTPQKIPEAASAGYSGESDDKRDEGSILNSAGTILMRRGVNEIVPVAVHHLNRIVTPFVTPEVKTGANADVSIEDNVIYVATAESTPVTLFINEQGNQDVSLNLTLVPRKIPSREIFLHVEDGVATPNFRGSAKANRWEKSQPYIETIRSLFRGLALGELPQGYRLGKFPNSKPAPGCAMEGLDFTFRGGQQLMGHNLQVSVGVVSNTGERPLEIREAVCGGWDVVAVAAWPTNWLEPGEKAEIYVAERMNRSTKAVSKRPSLLGGQ